MRKLSLVIFLIFSCIIAIKAQTHALQQNTNIVFYPVSQLIAEQYNGYDCFYETDMVYKKGKLNLKPKYRFKANAIFLTSFEEIKNYVFHVDRTEKIEVKKVPYYCAFLTRSDGKKITLAVPFWDSKNTTSNIITKSMIRKNYDKNFHYSYGIDIPFIETDELELAKKTYTDTDIIRYCLNQKKVSERIDVLTYIKGNTKKNKIWGTDSRQSMYLNRIDRMNNRINSRFNDPIHTIFNPGFIVHGIDIEWKSSDLCYFCQPCVHVEWNGDSYYLPLKDIYGYSNEGADVDYHNCLLSDFYQPVSDIYSLIPKPSIIPELTYGEQYYFNYHNDYNVAKIKGRKYPTLYSHDLTKGYYTVIKEGICPAYTQNDIKYGVFLLTSQNDSIFVSYPEFHEGFISKDEVDRLIAYNERVEAERRQQLLKDIASIEKKYGKTYSEYYANLSDSDQTKFKTAASKWGARDAKDIVEGYVRIGWTKEKCRLSWGAPRDINKSTYSWGTHEQWCYYSSYLYFKDGILTSIQN